MNLCGIIVEYNPLHNGHIRHIRKAKSLEGVDGLVAVMSGNFTQRGEVSIIDKFTKTRAALANGVNLVIELPFVKTVQNASFFGRYSVEILKALKVQHLLFGSESADLANLEAIADTEINVDHLKEIMKSGASYPKAYGLLQGAFYPNDILAIAYLKALKGSNIKAHLIQRNSSYQSAEISSSIASAKAIREALKNKDANYQRATPLVIDNPHFNFDLYPYIRTTILTSSRQELAEYFLVNEGLEKAFYNSALKNEHYDAFIQDMISRRYTKARLERTLVYIMSHITKKEMAALEDITYCRILGFDQRGQEILQALKKQDIPLISQFKKIPESYRKLEWRSDLLYAALLSEEKRQAFLKQELAGPLISNCP